MRRRNTAHLSDPFASARLPRRMASQPSVNSPAGERSRSLTSSQPPRRHGTLMSATQSRAGPSALNCRSTRSTTVAAASARTVVVMKRFGATPRSPAAHQPRTPLAAHPDPVIVGELRVDHRCSEIVQGLVSCQSAITPSLALRRLRVRASCTTTNALVRTAGEN
jgi:hypothetical protein